MINEFVTKGLDGFDIGGFRNSLCDVIFAHAHIAGRQYNGQHNGQTYGIHVKM